MIPRIMGILWVSVDYSRRRDQSSLRSLSSTPIQMLEILSWRLRTTIAATSPTPARIFENVSAPVSSSGSSIVERVGFWVADSEVGLSGFVGGLSATVAFGSDTVDAPPGRGAFAVLSAIVGAPIGAFVVASLMVGAPTVGAPAVRKGMVGAGTGTLGAVGAPEGGRVAVGGFGAVGMGGATGGVGGLIVGAGFVGSAAEGTAGGASAAFRVTRTVSFFSGTLDVCFEGVLFSFSLMRFGFLASSKSKAISHHPVKPTSLEIPCFPRKY